MESDFNLKKLFIDIDYQKEFTYEERVDYFNKYGISTSLPFFTPFYHLIVMILNYSSFNLNTSYGYGHGKYVLTNYLKDAEEKKYDYMHYKDLGKGKEYMKVFPMQPNTYVRMWAENGIITSIVIDNRSVRIPKIDVYAKVEEFLIDFKFKKTL